MVFVRFAELEILIIKKVYLHTKSYNGFYSTKNLLFKKKKKNGVQFFFKNTLILTAVSIDYSPVFLSISKKQNASKGHSFWKLDNSFLNNQTYIGNVKNLIEDFLANQISNKNLQIKWELL